MHACATLYACFLVCTLVHRLLAWSCARSCIGLHYLWVTCEKPSSTPRSDRLLYQISVELCVFDITLSLHESQCPLRMCAQSPLPSRLPSSMTLPHWVAVVFTGLCLCLVFTLMLHCLLVRASALCLLVSCARLRIGLCNCHVSGLCVVCLTDCLFLVVCSVGCCGSGIE